MGTNGAILTLLGMVVLASAALWGMVRGLATQGRNHPSGSAVGGCAAIFVAQCAFAVWPVTHYLDRMDGHTDLTGSGLRTVTQLAWIWLLVVGVVLLVQASASDARRRPDSEAVDAGTEVGV